MTQNNIIKKVEEKLEQHIASGSTKDFSMPSELSAEFSALARDLEMKRQLGQLTKAESKLIRKIDDLVERIAKFNSRKQERERDERGGVYDLPQKKVLEDAPDERPVIVPDISDEQADQIIEGLNKQFEEKVLGQINNSRKKRDEPPASEQVLESGDDEGVTLQNYISNFTDDRPDQPFTDDDSHFDLAKLVDKDNG